jgi:acyl carrier protein
MQEEGVEAMVERKVRGFILDKFPAARKKGLNDTVNLLESGIIDSLGILELVTFLEQQFGIQVEDDELVPENFQTTGTLAAFVERKGGRSAGNSA